MSEYRIESVYTEFNLISVDAKEGAPVITSRSGFTAFYIDPPIREEATTATIKGDGGLYVALPKKPVTGDKLIWSKEKYQWVIRSVVTPPGNSFELTPAEGEDLYWYDKSGIGNVILVSDGKDLTPPQQYFKITFLPPA